MFRSISSLMQRDLAHCAQMKKNTLPIQQFYEKRLVTIGSQHANPYSKPISNLRHFTQTVTMGRCAAVFRDGQKCKSV